jgi:hypothetical protein
MIVPPLTSRRLDNTTTRNRKLIINYKDFDHAPTTTISKRRRKRREKRETIIIE